MSGQATGWVLRDGPRQEDIDRHGNRYGLVKARTLRAVLVTIADAANRDGAHAHPGLAAMTEGSLYSRRTVQTAIEELVAEGWLTIEAKGGGRGKATVFAVEMDRRNGASVAPFPSTSESETAQPVDPKGAETVQDPGETVQRQVPDQGVCIANGFSNGNGSEQRTTERAVAVTRAAWDRRPKKPTSPFVALVKMTGRFLDAGWTEQQVEDAMVRTRSFTDAAVEYTLNQTHPSGPSPRQQRKAAANDQFARGEQPTGAVGRAFFRDQPADVARQEIR